MRDRFAVICGVIGVEMGSAPPDVVERPELLDHLEPEVGHQDRSGCEAAPGGNGLENASGYRLAKR